MPPTSTPRRVSSSATRRALRLSSLAREVSSALMSSLPPYNPRLGDDLMWLLAVNDPLELPRAMPAPPSGWTVTFVDQQALASAASELCPGSELKVVAHASEIVIPRAGWSMVLGIPDFVESALRRAMGMPDGTARFIALPGAVSLVQFLPGRAILVHLNQGHALDIPGE